MRETGRKTLRNGRWKGLAAAVLLALALCGWAGCAPAVGAPEAAVTPRPSATVMMGSTQIAATRTLPPPSPTLAPPVSPNPTGAVEMCAPLAGYDFEALVGAVSNPFNPPAPGSDDPHHGVDFAIVQSGVAQAGGQVQNVLAGRVALVLDDRFPYGNAALVETPLEGLPDEWAAGYVPAAPAKPSALTCPEVEEQIFTPGDERSLYLLYAHLQEPPGLEAGQQIACGAPVGLVGQSGNAMNPHLHLEARIGPAGARFTGMAHYTNSASPSEMHQYCLWRVSGVFQLVDPLALLKNLP